MIISRKFVAANPEMHAEKCRHAPKRMSRFSVVCRLPIHCALRFVYLQISNSPQTVGDHTTAQSQCQHSFCKLPDRLGTTGHPRFRINILKASSIVGSAFASSAFSTGPLNKESGTTVARQNCPIIPRGRSEVERNSGYDGQLSSGILDK